MDARHSARLAAASAALTVAACGGGEQSEPARVAGPAGAPSMIVQDDAELLFAGPARAKRAIDLLHASGVRAVRVTAGWSQLAPGPRSGTRPVFDASDPDAYRAKGWAPIDRAVRLARERGMAAMIDISFWAPVWATDGDVGERPRTGVDPREYARFAGAVARRYRGEVGTFTLWNEPNHLGYLAPQFERGRPASPHLYRRMVAAAYPAVKREDPEARVLIGALASHRRKHGIAPLHFLRELACVDTGLRPLRRPECADFARVPGDGLSYHPYSTNTRPDLVERSVSPDDAPLARIGRLSALLDRLVVAGRLHGRVRDIYLTEYGYETNPPDAAAPFSPGRAARMMAFAEALAAREPRVRAFSQFLVRDIPATPEGQRRLPDWQSGLLFADGRPKPLASVLPAPLHAERVDASFVRLWGRIRPGNGQRRVRIESANAPGAWRRVLDGRTDAEGVVEWELQARRGAVFRIGRRESGRWVYGPAVDALR